MISERVSHILGLNWSPQDSHYHHTETTPAFTPKKSMFYVIDGTRTMQTGNACSPLPIMLR